MMAISLRIASIFNMFPDFVIFTAYSDPSTLDNAMTVAVAPDNLDLFQNVFGIKRRGHS